MAGGYVRKTLSLPAALVEKIDAYLAANPGETLSWFMSNAGEAHLVNMTKKGRR